MTKAPLLEQRGLHSRRSNTIMSTVPAITDMYENKQRIRRARHDAKRSQRVIAANFRRIARQQGISVFALRRKAAITPWRMLWLWTGVHILINDMFRAQYALGMSVENVFEGTR
jgi:hypothetical protein